MCFARSTLHYSPQQERKGDRETVDRDRATLGDNRSRTHPKRNQKCGMYQSTGLTTHESPPKARARFFRARTRRRRGRLSKLLVPRRSLFFGFMTPLANRALPPFWRERVPFEGQRLLTPGHACCHDNCCNFASYRRTKLIVFVEWAGGSGVGSGDANKARQTPRDACLCLLLLVSLRLSRRFPLVKSAVKQALMAKP